MIWSRNSAASWLLKNSTAVLCAASGARYKCNFKFSKANSTVILRNAFSTEQCIQQQWKFECWKASSVVIFRSTLSSKLTFENLYRGSARGVWRQAEILKSQLAGYMCHVKSLYKWHSRIFTSAAWIPTARVLPPLKLLKVGSVASLRRHSLGSKLTFEKFHQRCMDPDCSSYRTREWPLPVMFSQKSACW